MTKESVNADVIIIINIGLIILFIFLCIFLMSWAVMRKRKTYVVWDGLYLFLCRFFNCVLGGISGFSQIVNLCSSTARKTVPLKKYVRKNDATLLEEQLNDAKAMFESGSITAEEYEERRKNILNRSAGAD